VDSDIIVASTILYTLAWDSLKQAIIVQLLGPAVFSAGNLDWIAIFTPIKQVQIQVVIHCHQFLVVV
jgi:hypothetical protein